MARIRAGNTLANQYAPPFVVSDSVSTNWHLRWNDNYKAFEAYNPDENVVVSGFDSIQVATFLNVTQQVFVVPWEIDSTLTQVQQKATLIISWNGVKQQQDAYTVRVNAGSGTTTVTLSQPVSGDDVEIIGLQTSGGASIELYQETAAAAQTLFPVTGGIGWYPASEQSLIITLDGIKLNTSEYSIVNNANYTDAQIQLSAAPGDGVDVEIIGIATAGETPASPVNVASAFGLDTGTVFSTFASKTLSGDTQILNFKSLEAGTGITIADNTNRLTITADTQLTLTQTGTGGGTSLFDQNDPAAGEFRKILAGDRIILSVSGADNPIIVDYNLGYQDVIQGTDADPYVQVATDKLIGITSLAAAQGITLLAASAIPVGDTVTIKNQTASTQDITITPVSGTIDGAATHTINTAYGYVTLYSDGTNYYIIAQG